MRVCVENIDSQNSDDEQKQVYTGDIPVRMCEGHLKSKVSRIPFRHIFMLHHFSETSAYSARRTLALVGLFTSRTY